MLHIVQPINVVPVQPAQEKLKAMDATFAHPKTSDKYKFISTADIVSKFGEFGWHPVKYTEANTRKYQGYQTHVVQLGCPDGGVAKVGDCNLRILIINNHHASKALQIKVGLFRLVCSNGLVVQDADFGSLSVRHMGLTVDAQLAEILEKIKVIAESLRTKLAAWQTHILTTEERNEFARNALATRFKPEEVTSDMISAVQMANRAEDARGDAWTVFNNVQENLIRGFDSADRTRRIRRIGSVQRDLDINAQLWTLLPKVA